MAAPILYGYNLSSRVTSLERLCEDLSRRLAAFEAQPASSIIGKYHGRSVLAAEQAPSGEYSQCPADEKSEQCPAGADEECEKFIADADLFFSWLLHPRQKTSGLVFHQTGILWYGVLMLVFLLFVVYFQFSGMDTKFTNHMFGAWPVQSESFTAIIDVCNVSGKDLHNMKVFPLGAAKTFVSNAAIVFQSHNQVATEDQQVHSLKVTVRHPTAILAVNGSYGGNFVVNDSTKGKELKQRFVAEKTQGCARDAAGKAVNLVFVTCQNRFERSVRIAIIQSFALFLISLSVIQEMRHGITAAFLAAHSDLNIFVVATYATMWYLVVPAATLVLGYHVVLESESNLDILKDCLALLLIVDANNIMQFMFCSSSPRFKVELPLSEMMVLRVAQRRFMFLAGMISLVASGISLAAWFMTVWYPLAVVLPMATHIDTIGVGFLTCIYLWSAHTTRSKSKRLVKTQITQNFDLDMHGESIANLLWAEDEIDSSACSDEGSK